MAYFAASGAPLPKRFSVTALCLTRRPKPASVVCFPLIDSSNLYLYVISGPLAKRTLFLTITEPSPEGEQRRVSSGLFVDPIEPTRIAPLPKVDVVLEDTTKEDFSELLSAADIGEDMVWPEEFSNEELPSTESEPDWESVYGDKFSVLVHFDAELSGDKTFSTPAKITNFRFEPLDGLPPGEDLFNSPSTTLPGRANSPLLERCYRAAQMFKPAADASSLRQRFEAISTLPPSFEVEGILSEEEAASGSFFDCLFAVRKISVAQGPLAGSTLLLRLFDKDWFRFPQDHVLLPAPYGPGLSAAQCSLTQLSEHAFSAGLSGDKEGSAKLFDAGYSAKKLSFGNVERYGEVRLFLPPKTYRSLTHGLKHTERLLVRFTITRPRDQFSLPLVTGLTVESLGTFGRSQWSSGDGDGGGAGGGGGGKKANHLRVVRKDDSKGKEAL